MEVIFLLKIAVGHSEDVDEIDAVKEVLEQCNEKLGNLIPQAGILYCAVNFEHGLILNEINLKYPNIELIGCTTDGEMSSRLGCIEDSITLILFYSDTIQIKTGLGTELSNNIDEATKNAVNEAQSKLDNEAKFCVVLSESLTVSGVAMLKGIQKTIGVKFPIFGGLAADQWGMKKTYQFYKDQVLTDSVQVMLFSGDIIFSSGIANGWEPIGHKKRVSKVDKNIVYELEDEPILDFYNKYLGGNYSRVPTEYPLAVFPENDDKFFIRSPFTFNENDKSITFFGDITENAIVQLVAGTTEKISVASETALKNAIDGYRGISPQAALVFTCSARKAILGTKVSKEYLLMKERMPEDFSICGFYTYGELAPLYNGEESRFHNGTIAVLLIGEK